MVHAVNPPGYRNWKHLVLPMLRNTIGAAERTGALIVLPGTVYNYGPDAFPLLREDAQQTPVTRKGAIRVQMEKELAAYSQRGGRVLIVRAGDFFGPRAGNNWFSQGLIKPGKPPGVITNPASFATGHQWAYLPDVAETIAALLGDSLSAEQAAQWGMIWQVVDDAELKDTSLALARHLAAQPTYGLGLIKNALRLAETQTLDQQLDLERDYQRLAGRSADYREGVSAFLAKRPPHFSGK
ncbi:enoyl-CoA hydratase-related protein [Klebsiella michiganensis]